MLKENYGIDQIRNSLVLHGNTKERKTRKYGFHSMNQAIEFLKPYNFGDPAIKKCIYFLISQV